MTDRRDFIKLLSVVLGGATLSACSNVVPGLEEEDDPEVLPLPNAYTFYGIKYSGDPLPGGGTIENLRLDAAINDQGSIIYGTSQLAADAAALYQITLNFTNNQAPSIPNGVYEQKIAQQGDTLPSGNTITGLGSYDTNSQGDVALVVESQASDAPFRGRAVHMFRNDGNGIQAPILDTFHNLNGEQRLDDYIDVSLNDDGSIATVCRFAYPKSGETGFSQIGQGAFYFQARGSRLQGRLLVQSNQMLSDTEDVYIQGLGLIDITPNGQYVLQAQGGQASTVAPVTGTPTMLLQGAVNQGEPRLVSASPLLGAAAIETAQSIGGTLYGPRIAFDQTNSLTIVGNVVHNSDTNLTLFYNGQGIESASNTVTSGSGVTAQQAGTLQSLSAPDMAPSGLIFYVRLYGDATNELVVSNGTQESVLLSTGDTVNNLQGDNPKTVGSIMFGHTASHINTAGNVAFTIVFTDATAAVVVGVPS